METLVTIIIIALITFFVVANWWTNQRPLQRSAKDVANTLKAFLTESGGPYDWDDFLQFRIADPSLDALRRRCDAIDWMTDAGREKIRQELEALRSGAR